MPENAKNNSQKPTLSEKINQLDRAVEWFSGDEFELDQALTKYQAATKLAAEIDHDLAELKNQIEIIEDFTKD